MLINKERAGRIMAENGLDALVATTPENVAYLTGFWILTHLRHRVRQVFAVVTADDLQADLVISRGLADAAIAADTWVKTYRLYGNFYFSTASLDNGDAEAKRLMALLDSSPSYPAAVDALAGCLAERGVARGRIGVDQGSDTIGLGRVLEGRLPGLSTAPAYDLFRQIRIVKTAGEIDRIRNAVSVNESALTEAIAAIGEGVGENAVAATFFNGVARRGGLPTLVCVGSGPRGALPNVTAGDRIIHRGDAVRFDVGCIASAYHADMARTAVLGKPSSKIQIYHDALVAGEQGILSTIRPGAVAGDLFHLGVDIVRANGIPHYERNHCGHGNGIEGYDLPHIAPADRTVLEPGMVLCIETPYYEPGFAGLQIEDVVAVTETGCERISSIEQKLFIV